MTGAPWSAEELVIVKSKLYSMFKSQYVPFASWPRSAQKVLRLAFHDCLRYSVCEHIYLFNLLKFSKHIFKNLKSFFRMVQEDVMDV